MDYVSNERMKPAIYKLRTKLLCQNITNEQRTYDPEAIKKFRYNVAEA